MERAIDGMAAAAAALETPVISGNVSLYNESYGQGIFPTPVVGMVGLIEGRAPTPSAWRGEGDVVALLGDWSAEPGELGGSTYLAAIHETVAGHPPLLDLDRERAVQAATLAGIEARADPLGARLLGWRAGGGAGGVRDLVGYRPARRGGAARWRASDALATLAALYGEAPSRIIVSVAAEPLRGAGGAGADASASR